MIRQCYDRTVTAREKLSDLFETLTEEEAAACVEAIAECRTKTKWHDPREDEWPLKPKVSREDAAEFFRDWAKSGPTLTEEEWEDFANSLDVTRPHRPLFR